MSEADPTIQESAAAWQKYATELESKVHALEASAVPPLRWYQNPKVAGVISEVTGSLTLLASLSYTLGPAAEILPPAVKTYISSIGVFATLALQLWKRYLEPKAADVALAATGTPVPVTTPISPAA